MTGYRGWIAIVLAGLASLACLSTDVGSTETVTGVISGRIVRTDTLGVESGVEGALLGVQLETVPVSGVAQVLSSGQLTSAADGSYLVVFIVQDKADMPARVRLMVTPPIGSQLLAKDTSGIPINLYKVSPPADSAYLFVRLQHR